MDKQEDSYFPEPSAGSSSPDFKNNLTPAEIKGILPESDEKDIEEGILVLAHKLETLNPDQLPSLALYPDISARPLYWATMPVLREAYHQKGVHAPQIRFLPTGSISSYPFVLFNSYEENHGSKLQGMTSESEKIDALLQIMIDEIADLGGELSRTMAENFRTSAEIVKQGREALNAKLTEVLGPVVVQHALIIDDYSKAERTTLREIHRALQKTNPAVETIGFALLSGIPVFDDEEPAQTVDGLSIVIGKTDPKTSQTNRVFFSGGLQYRAPDSSLFGGKINAERNIGVHKGQDLSVHPTSRSENPQNATDLKYMVYLRERLKQIGEKVAKSMK